MAVPPVSAKTRIPHAEALAIAQAAMALLQPACERLAIAGSLRRGRPDVGDVELVAVPRVHPVAADLFGERLGEVDELDELVANLTGRPTDLGIRPGSARARAASGPRYKALAFRGFPLDLFSVREPASWGVIFLLRTGPAGFSKRLVTPRVHGGALPLGYRVKDGALWNAGERLATPEEADYFAHLRAPYLAPEQRTDTVRLSLASRAGAPARWAWYDGDARTGWWAVQPANGAVARTTERGGS